VCTTLERADVWPQRHTHTHAHTHTHTPPSTPQVSPLLVNGSSPRSVLRRYPADLVPGPYPVTGIGKSDFFPDLLLVPNFHFHMRCDDGK
jgi:hypothetical protein